MSGSPALPVVPPANETRGDKTEAVGMRMSRAMLKRVEAVSEATGRSVSDVLRFLVAAGLEAYEHENSKKK